MAVTHTLSRTSSTMKVVTSSSRSQPRTGTTLRGRQWMRRPASRRNGLGTSPALRGIMTTPYHDYHIGQQVACVNADAPAGQTFELTKDAAYTIRWVGIYNSYLAGEYLGLRLEGVERGECPFTNDQDPPFRADRFRPLVLDRLSALRQAAADPHGPVQGDVDGPRKRVREEEGV